MYAVLRDKAAFNSTMISAKEAEQGKAFNLEVRNRKSHPYTSALKKRKIGKNSYYMEP